MLFNDERRFSKQLVASPGDSSVMGVVNPSTDINLGPGAYYNTSLNEKRNGWQSRSFSRRSPMTPSPRESPRNEGGVLTPYGAIASPVSPKNRVSVGPGHYEGDVLNSFSRNVSRSLTPHPLPCVCSCAISVHLCQPLI